MKRVRVHVGKLLVGTTMSAFGVLLVAASPSGKPASRWVQPVGTAGCNRSTLSQRPGWTSSGIWTVSADGDRLLLADALQKTILTYDSSGRFLGPLAGTNGMALNSLRPLVLKENASTHTLVAELDGAGFQDYNRILTLDRKFAPGPLHAVETEKANAEGSRISGLWEWEPVGPDLVTFSDLQGARNDWHSAIVRYPAGEPDNFTMLHFVGLHDPERTFYRLGYQYITSLGNTAYVLTMGNTPGIYKDTDLNGKKAATLVAVRSSLSTTDKPELSPQVPEFLYQRDFEGVMAAVERVAMPTGIYGWEQNLYVLSRIPEGGETIWVLRKFDSEGRFLDAFRIPAKANHLTVVPGPKDWAFVEKGPVLGYRLVQDIKTILFVPSRLLRAKSPSPPGAALTAAPSICQ